MRTIDASAARACRPSHSTIREPHRTSVKTSYLFTGRIRRRAFAKIPSSLFATLLAPALIAQTTPAPSSTSTNPPPVQLSVFEVSAEKDVGYQAGNTTSGSRLNSSLKDTAAAVMVFTPEFMSDFNVTSLEDMVAYAPNMAVDMLDTSADANPQFLGGSDLRDTRIRVRGLSASTSVDFFETGSRSTRITASAWSSPAVPTRFSSGSVHPAVSSTS